MTRRNYVDQSTFSKDEIVDGVRHSVMHINTDTLKTEVVSSGYYKFLSLPKDNLSPLSDSFPMTGKINQNFDIELMCLKIDLNYIKYQRSELHRSIILKRFGIVE